MVAVQIEPGRIYTGYIISDNEYKNKDPKNLGRYRVYIPVLSPGPEIKENEGFWVRNQFGNNLVSSQKGSYGTYYPQQPESGKNSNRGTQVKVRFDSKDPQSGQIISSVVDHIDGAMPKIGSAPTTDEAEVGYLDRDRTFVPVKTPSGNSIVLLEPDIEGSSSDSSSSININYKGKRTTIVINDDGIHFYSDDNLGITISKDNNILVKGNSKIEIDGDNDIYCKGDSKIYSSGDIDVKSDGGIKAEAASNVDVKAAAAVQIYAAANVELKGAVNVDIEATGIVNIKGGPAINLQAASVNINGVAAPAATASGASKASTNEGEDENETQNKVTISD